jgi:hypothetical protein
MKWDEYERRGGDDLLCVWGGEWVSEELKWNETTVVTKKDTFKSIWCFWNIPLGQFTAETQSPVRKMRLHEKEFGFILQDGGCFVKVWELNYNGPLWCLSFSDEFEVKQWLWMRYDPLGSNIILQHPVALCILVVHVQRQLIFTCLRLFII